MPKTILRNRSIRELENLAMEFGFKHLDLTVHKISDEHGTEDAMILLVYERVDPEKSFNTLTLVKNAARILGTDVEVTHMDVSCANYDIHEENETKFVCKCIFDNYNNNLDRGI